LVSVTWILLESFQLLEQVPTVASSEPQVVVVQAGDTLWNIAKMNAPEHLEFTDYMNKIKKANELNSSGLMLGQTLILP
jgi:LysM repeat protein